MASKEKVS
jgi:hypothetical protein